MHLIKSNQIKLDEVDEDHSEGHSDRDGVCGSREGVSCLGAVTGPLYLNAWECISMDWIGLDEKESMTLHIKTVGDAITAGITIDNTTATTSTTA